MSKLIFTLKYADEKFPKYLETHFGKDFADKALVESTQTSSVHEAKIQVLDFKKDKSILDKLSKDENVSSVFLVEDKKVISSL